MQFKKKHVRRMSMDITPLIDVVFLLLIFLLLSTTFISSPGIHINLPSAAIKQKSDKQKSLEISITKDDKLYIFGKIIKKNNLIQELSNQKHQLNSQTLIIRADGKVEHQLVVFVMDSAKQAGIKKLSIATQPKKSIRTKKSL
jgi:biopolymer transport protein ExbD